MEAHSTEANGSSRTSPVSPTRTQTQAGPIVNLNVQGNVSVIHCEKNSRRSSHHHLTDWHYLFVASGRMTYWERPVGDDGPPFEREVFPGEMVYTGPMMDHWTDFEVPTTLIRVSKLHRTHEAHEADLVRVEWFE